MTAGAEGSGDGSRRRSGRRSAEPLQRIPLGSSSPAEEPDADDEPLDAEAPAAAPPASDHPSPPRRSGSASRRRRGGLDRIRPRTTTAVARPAAGQGGSASGARAPAPSRPRPDDLGGIDAGERDPLGRAALYSSDAGHQPPALGTFLVECSACHRETPVTAGDLIRLGIPSLHLLFLKRYPSLMRCPACGRRTWVRIRWRL